MARKFNGKQLIESMVLMEQKVGEFYNKLSGQMKDEKAKNLFLKLAKDENRHEKIYKGLLNRLPNDGDVEMSEEDVEYIELLINKSIFVNKEVEKRYSKFDALLLAEKVERDGIMFVNLLREMYPKIVQDELDIILSEEKKHLKTVLDNKIYSSAPLLML